MKLMRWLAVVVFLSACTKDEQATPPPQQQPEAAAQGTAGTTPPEPRQAATAPASATERKDAKAAATGPVAEAARRDGVNVDAAVLQSFNARVQRYLDIHKDAAKGSAKLKQTDDPAKINAAQDELAARIQAARADAKWGDIFTAEVRHKFRRLLAPELTGEDGRDAKALMKDDAPPPANIPFKVNAKYPEGQPLPTVASNVLLALPTLPKPLEYRFIGKHLILLDTDANLIVDFIPNAMR